MNNNPTAAQMDVLMTFLEEHQELARGHLRNAEGRIRSKHLWIQLTAKLNALRGCIKNTKQWQKVWADKKYLAKRAAANARQTAAATIGPSTAEQLTAKELRIIALIGEEYGKPDTDARVPTLLDSVTVQDHNNTQEEKEVQASMSPILPSPRPMHNIRDSQQQREETPVRRRRFRRINNNIMAVHNVRTRLFELEARRVAAETQRVQELSLIRQSIQGLSRVLQTNLQDILVELRTLRK